jgi:hypothetical protein
MSGSKVWEDLAKQLAESIGKANIYVMLKSFRLQWIL